MSSTSFSLEGGSFGDLSTVVLRAGESDCVIDVEESFVTVENHSPCTTSSSTANAPEASSPCADGFEDVLNLNTLTCSSGSSMSKALSPPQADALASLRYTICK